MSDFSDVDAGSYYENAVAWASDNEIVTGYGDGIFGPNDPITREQMSAILYRYAIYKGYNVAERADISAFSDYEDISDYARESIAWANAAGLINGMDASTILPQGEATRAQIAAILHRFCENIK